MLLDTISVDIIAQMRRKQLSRYLLYLVFRGWRFFLRGFLLQYLIVCFGMQPTPLRNVSPPQSRDKKFSCRTTVCCAGTSAVNDRGRKQWWPFVLAGFAQPSWLCFSLIALMYAQRNQVVYGYESFCFAARNLVLPWFFLCRPWLIFLGRSFPWSERWH